MNELKYKIGDRVRIKSLDWYNKNKNEDGIIGCGNANFIPNMKIYCGDILTICDINEELSYYYVIGCQYTFKDEMIECKVEEETPKFKVNDIVFVKNIGWVRITNSYWDSLANEYIYEAIGFNGEGEYDSINQSNIECQMLPESENQHTGGNKITLEEYKNNDKEWLFNKLAMLDNITALESIQDIFNHLQQSKYPKTYEECAMLLGLGVLNELKHYNLNILYKKDLIDALQKLIICRDAYWKLYGEDMRLGRPWNPSDTKYKYIIRRAKDEILKGYNVSSVLEFPTEEMRDTFYENFKKEIEMCKELL